MAKYVIEDTTLTGIADAIRAKAGTTDSIAVGDMATRIAAITGGGTSEGSSSLGGSVEGIVYVTFMNGEVELCKTACMAGDSTIDPVEDGKIAVPTKDPTESTVYTYAGGWSLTDGGEADVTALVDVGEDRVVYAAYTESVREYTVNFYDDDGTTLLESLQVAYGQVPSPAEPVKTGCYFESWTPELTVVTGDADYRAVWGEALTFANATWAQIAEISEAGTAASTFAVGDCKQITLTDGSTCVVEIVGFNHDPLTADTTKTAGISLLCKTVPNLQITPTAGYASYKNVAYKFKFGWKTTPFAERTWCNETLYATLLPEAVRTVIKQVQKKCHYYCKWSGGGATATDSFYATTCDDYCWVPSFWEIGADGTTDLFNDPVIGDGAGTASYTLPTQPDGICYARFADMVSLGAAAYHAAVPVYIDGTETEPEYHLLRSCVDGVGRGYLTATGASHTNPSSVYLRFGFCV